MYRQRAIPPHVAKPFGRSQVPIFVEEHAPASPAHPASAAAGSQRSAIVSPPDAEQLASHRPVMFPLAFDRRQQTVFPEHCA
jgi:hypothetical protein